MRGGGDRQFADASIARNPALLEIVTGKSPAGSARDRPDPRVPAPSCAVEKSRESAPSHRKRGRNPWRIKRLQRREIASGGACGMLAMTIKRTASRSARMAAEVRRCVRSGTSSPWRARIFHATPNQGGRNPADVEGANARRAQVAPDDWRKHADRKTVPIGAASLFRRVVRRPVRGSTAHPKIDRALRSKGTSQVHYPIEGSIDAADAAGGMASVGAPASTNSTIGPSCPRSAACRISRLIGVPCPHPRSPGSRCPRST
jgi:hypothetical protein